MRGLSVILLIPEVWRALRRARQRLRGSLQQALQLDSPKVCRRAFHADTLARVVFGVGRRMRACACLPQAIALANLLRARGLVAQVVLGANRPGAVDAGPAHAPRRAFAAHAWVEAEGRVYDPQPANLAAFTRIYEAGRE